MSKHLFHASVHLGAAREGSIPRLFYALRNIMASIITSTYVEVVIVCAWP